MEPTKATDLKSTTEQARKLRNLLDEVDARMRPVLARRGQVRMLHDELQDVVVSAERLEAALSSTRDRAAEFPCMYVFEDMLLTARGIARHLHAAAEVSSDLVVIDGIDRTTRS